MIKVNTTIVKPIIVAHKEPFFSKKEENDEPNLNDKQATIKNLKPLANKQVKKKKIKLY